MQDQPRLHCTEPLAGGVTIALDPAQAHYLGGVLRRSPGDAVTLFNERDGEWDATIAALRKDRCQVTVGAQRRPPRSEPGPALLFAPIKRDATDLVVRMATELGAASIRPVLTERTNAARVNLDRWRAIATEAAEQCERLSVPRIAEPVRLPDLLGSWDDAVPLLAALERAPEGEDTRRSAAGWRRDAPPAVQPALLVGPEGGFSPAERGLLARCGFVVPVRLGPLVLRAETASLAGLSALLG
ncbi:16S rRNA (uracil(1498)-N(3))-methyltransferase [Acetobacteraceae bacterium KSS8]|uniref:Ribosomal RNA small subunit methyltransferase E n=1 Tax=Endosaccharibacter trunci TaxID=2812733 RepID=A0ABT1WA91_9PROT|nr:16S rRNA (uracil(1498)-N(3))-methyltransferase [Acetobacteraceae bacterium KSS8]